MMSSQQPATAEEFAGGREQQQLVTDYFHRNATVWRHLYDRHDLRSVIYQRRRNLVLDLVAGLGSPPGASALEIGCGAGLVSVAVARQGYAVDAVDCAAGMLEQTRVLARDCGVAGRVRLSAAEAYRLPFKNASFSLVLAIGVLPWLASPGMALTEMHRVLAPGGALVATSDNRRRLAHLLDPLEWARPCIGRMLRRAGLRKIPHSPRVNMTTLREMDAALERAGFTKRFGATEGFGPLTLFGCSVLPNRIGLALNDCLQHLTQHGFPVLRAAGSQYVFLAAKQ